MPTRPGPPKYQPLTDYLAALAAGEVTLPLGEIEAIVGVPLPPSARTPNFWTNGRSGIVRDRPWTRAGWQVARNHLRSTTPAVAFARRLTDRTASVTGR